MGFGDRGGRGRGGGGFGGRGRGRGGGGGFKRYEDAGPPEYVVEVGEYTHLCQNDMVCKATHEKIPYFNAPIFLENKNQIGKIDEIFGPINEFCFSVKLSDNMKANSFKALTKLFIDPQKLLPLQRFLPKPKGAGGRGRGGFGRGGDRGRGGGRGFRGGGGFRGSGGFRGGGGGFRGGSGDRGRGGFRGRGDGFRGRGDGFRGRGGSRGGGFSSRGGASGGGFNNKKTFGD